MTGTNLQDEAFKKLKEGEFSRQNVTNALETVKDGYADLKILYSPASDQNYRYANTQEFINKIKVSMTLILLLTFTRWKRCGSSRNE